MFKLLIVVLTYIASFGYAYAYDDEVQCLAKNIYFEARNQGFDGQQAVAFVTMNRVKSKAYPDTICDVVWQRKQFSWTHDGKSDVPKNKKSWKEALSIAIYIYTFYDMLRDPTYGAIMYHADYVNPYWTDAYHEIIQIENHIFYRRKNNG